MGDARYNATLNRYQTGNDPAADYLYAANGALTIADGVHAITKAASLAAMTLAPPTAADEGVRMVITARTAFAHTVTITEGLGGRGGAFVKMTFAAVGDTIELLADNLHWVPVAAPYGVVISA